MQNERFLIVSIIIGSFVLVTPTIAYSQIAAQQLTVKTDKSSYTTDEKIRVTGTIPAAQEPMPVIIQVFNPENSTYTIGMPAPNTNGTYSFEFAINGTMGTDGIYRVWANYSGQSQETRFEFKGKAMAPSINNNTVVVTLSNGSTLPIDANLSNGIITEIVAQQEEVASLVFSIRTNGTENSTLTVVLPRNIIDAKFEQDEITGRADDDRFVVLVDGDYSDYSETASTPTHRTLQIPIVTGTQEVEIGGTPIIPACVAPPSGLVSWWPGDGSADDIQGTNDGILQNGASFAPGKVGNGSSGGGGQAFRLDGIDDYVEIPSMNLGNTFSIDFWVYPDRSAGYENLISNHYTSNGSFGALYLHYGNLEYWHNTGQFFVQEQGSQTVQPNRWSHIVLTYDGNAIRIYLNDDELQSTSPATNHSETFNNALRIGSSIPHADSYLQGLIDDVGLYDRALSLSDIQAISQGGKCK